MTARFERRSQRMYEPGSACVCSRSIGGSTRRIVHVMVIGSSPGALQMTLERIEAAGPLRSIRLEPGVELHQRFGPKAVHTPLGITTDFHQPGRRAR